MESVHVHAGSKVVSVKRLTVQIHLARIMDSVLKAFAFVRRAGLVRIVLLKTNPPFRVFPTAQTMENLTHTPKNVSANLNLVAMTAPSNFVI